MHWASIIALLLVSLPSSAAGDEVRCCTVEELFGLWDEGHPLQRISAADLRVAREDAGAASGVWVPQAPIRGGLGTLSEMEGDSFTGIRNPHGVGFRSSVRVDFVAPLFASGQLWVLQDLAALGVEVAEAQMEAARQSFHWRARSTWLGVHSQRERTSFLTQALSVLDQLRTDRGDLSEQSPDSLALEVLSGDLVARRIRAEDALESARIRLGRFVGGSGELPDARGDGAPLLDIGGSLDAALKEAFRSRPDWLAAEKALRAAELNETLQSLRWLPEVGLVGRWTTRLASEITDQRGPYQRDPFNGGAGGMALGIQWELDPRLRLKDSGSAEWTAEGGRALLLALQAQIVAEVGEAFAAQDRALRRVNAEDNSTEAAAGWLEAQTLKSSRPEGLVAPFVKAVRQHLHRRDRQIAAHHGLAIARARLARVIGRDATP